MNRFSLKSVLLTGLMLFLASTISVVFEVKRVEASETIYIRADGRIDPPTANIASADNVTYIFMGNVDDSIVVERDNVTVDGAGHTLQMPGGDTGISLPYRTNVTIQHVVIMGFGVGIEVFFSNRCVLYGNRIEGTTYGPGIYVSNSGYNKIDGNNASNNQQGISISHSSNSNIIANNTFDNNSGSESGSGFGICLGDRSSNNVIINNTVNYNRPHGVILVDQGTDGNVIDGNTIVGNELGVDLWFYSNNNLFVGNLISSNSWGLHIATGSGNTIIGNNITNNTEVGIGLSDSEHNEILDNTLSSNGHSIWMSQSSNNLVDGNNASYNSGGISVGDFCSNNTIAHNVFDYNNGGIGLGNSSNNVIINNMVGYNGLGITVSRDSSGNVIRGNTMISNNGSIELWGNSSSNTVYHNNFINNTNQASGGDSLNVWDDGYPSGGNYWSDYSGVDMNHDGIGDASYVIGSERLQRDHYPLMGMFSSFNATSDFNVDVASNSTIHDFQYFQSNSTITMSVSNMTTEQSTGFCRVCIPHELINVTDISVIINDGAIQVLYPNYTLYDNGTHRWIYFAYEHSTHKVDIIPEFSLLIILPLMMTTTLLASAIRKRKQST
jgi:parallel beta-helix repeat protein